MNWSQIKYETVKLGDICKNLDGKRRPLNNKERNKIRGTGKYPYFGANNIMDWVDEYIFDEKILCIAEDGGNWGNNQKCSFIYNGKCWVNNHAHVLSGKDNVILEFLMYYLNFADLDSYITGSTRGKLTKSSLDNLQIPLPSLEVQQQIAALLDRADTLRQLDRQLLTHYDTLIQSVFLEMFGDKNPEVTAWPEVRIENLVAEKKGSMRSGPFGSDLLHSEFVDEGIFVLGIDNVVNNKFEWSKLRFITEEKYEKLKRYTVYPGDVLISIMATVGRCAVVPDDIPRAINSKHLAAITFNQQKVNPTFIAYSIHSDSRVRNQLTARNRGAIMDGLNLGLIKEIKIKLPPLALQQRFANIVAKIEAQKATAAAQADASEALFQGLLQKAFGKH